MFYVTYEMFPRIDLMVRTTEEPSIDGLLETDFTAVWCSITAIAESDAH